MRKWPVRACVCVCVCVSVCLCVCVSVSVCVLCVNDCEIISHSKFRTCLIKFVESFLWMYKPTVKDFVWEDQRGKVY